MGDPMVPIGDSWCPMGDPMVPGAPWGNYPTPWDPVVPHGRLYGARYDHITP